MPDLCRSGPSAVTTLVAGQLWRWFCARRRSDRDALVALMEWRRRYISCSAKLAEGIRWNWQSFPEWLCALRPGAVTHSTDSCASGTAPTRRASSSARRSAAFTGAAYNDDDHQLHGHARPRLQAVLAGRSGGFRPGAPDNHRSRSGLATPAAEATASAIRHCTLPLRGSAASVLRWRRLDL